MTPARVCSSCPLSDACSSRLRRVGPSMITASSRRSTVMACRCGSDAFCVSLTYCSNAPAAATPRGSASQPKPARSRVPNCRHNSRVAASSSKCQGGRRVMRTPSPKRFASTCSSSTMSSAGRRRSSSPASASPSATSVSRKRPPARSSQARPMPSRSANIAATRLSRLSDSSASSVRVPGVTIRVTLRSTGPLLVAGSPICSQMATDSPFLTSFAR